MSGRRILSGFDSSTIDAPSATKPAALWTLDTAPPSFPTPGSFTFPASLAANIAAAVPSNALVAADAAAVFINAGIAPDTSLDTLALAADILFFSLDNFLDTGLINFIVTDLGGRPDANNSAARRTSRNANFFFPAVSVVSVAIGIILCLPNCLAGFRGRVHIQVAIPV